MTLRVHWAGPQRPSPLGKAWCSLPPGTPSRPSPPRWCPQASPPPRRPPSPPGAESWSVSRGPPGLSWSGTQCQDGKWFHINRRLEIGWKQSDQSFLNFGTETTQYSARTLTIENGSLNMWSPTTFPKASMDRWIDVKIEELYRVSSKTVPTWLFALLLTSTHAKFRKFATW